ncbi:hypothetical protein A3K86_10835 [Photobacterium jeanii]|uniref:Phage abortive infection protein n=1 Tax=Photobacterium jeanii TaxID=858640 RepID=A0A178KGK9_9GAMM|nr:putative phage abortive infection protein [Photobacterium jeanii]OAN16361.1 hypothetical protein A3K86_10835 [Photobacterium jeanii]
MIERCKQHPKTVIALVVIAVFCATLIPFFTTFHYGLSNDQSDWGAFGSYFGGVVGSTFAALSFLCLLYTIYLQREELNTAIQALSDSASAQQEQASLIKIQRFEDTFYSLLAQHNESLSLLGNKDVLNSYLHNLHTIQQQEVLPDYYLKSRQEHILKNTELSQYFRILYQLLKYIAQNNPNNEKRIYNEAYLGDISNLKPNEKMYSSIVRSFVPVDLLPLLAINCIPTYSGLNNLSLYWSLLQRYEFLEHMRADKMPNNLSTWVVLDGYSYAFGENTTIKDKSNEIRKHFNGIFEEQLTEGNYLHSYFECNPY